MRNKIWIALSVLLAVAMLLAACQPAAPTPQVIVETVVVEGTPNVVVATPQPTEAGPARKVLRLAWGPGDIPTIDTALAVDVISIQLIDSMTVGLARQNEQTAELELAMATEVKTSDDGRTYTFTLKEGVPWVRYNGKEVEQVLDCEGKPRMVTAYDFEYGILRALKPETASPYAYVLDMAVQGAQDFTDGQTKDPATVGVKALDASTLEVKFVEPAAYNTNIIGLWTAMAVPKWLIEGDDCTEARGDRWIEPGFFQTFGPFTLKEWIHDSTMTIVKNPFWPGDQWTPQPKVDEVTFSMIDQAPAMAEFEAGNLDAAAVPSTDIDRVKADPKLSKLLVIAPNLCTYFYGFNTQAPVVNDVRVRRALSMAIDRQALVDNVLKGGQEPAQWLARPGLAAAPTMKDHPDLGVKFNPTEAKKLLDDYLKEKNTTADKLDITLMYNTDSGHQQIAEFMQQQWKTNLGINVKLTNQEWKTFLKTTKGKDTPQIYRMGWCLDYPDANNFTREVVASGGSNNPVDKDGKPAGGLMWKDDKFEKLVIDAAREQDPKKRVELYAQAEQILCYDDAVIIPLYWYTRVTVTQPWIKRTFSVGGHERYEHWEVLQDQ